MSLLSKINTARHNYEEIPNILHEKIRRFNNFMLPRIVERVSRYQNKYRIEDSIILSGLPRSGSTWVFELLSSFQGYTGIYEPLLLDWYPNAKLAGFNKRQFLYPNEYDQKKIDYFNEILKGTVYTTRPEYKFTLSNIMQRKKSNKLVIKFVRGNRLLPWISTNFNVKSIIYLLRHPLNNIASQIKSGYSGYWNPSIPTKQTILNELNKINVEDKIIDLIQKVSEDEEYLALFIGLDYHISFSYKCHNSWEIWCYEDLRFNGVRIINDWAKKKKLDYNLEDLRCRFKKPSIRTIDGINKKTNSWKSILTKKQVYNIKKVLENFEISINNEMYIIGGKEYPTERVNNYEK